LRVKGQGKPDDDIADSAVTPHIEATAQLHDEVLAIQRVIAVVLRPSRVLRVQRRCGQTTALMFIRRIKSRAKLKILILIRHFAQRLKVQII
jgi:hypothetical protein